MLDTRPRANEQLLREMITSVQDASVSRRLAEGLVALRKVQDQRNRAAHASIDCCFSEFSADEYAKVRADAMDVVNLLADVLLGVRAAKEWPLQEFSFSVRLRKKS